MRRDTQIGIILGIVILVIIGVFLSTRTSDNEAILPDLVLSEGRREKSEIEEIDINEIIKESRQAEPEEISSLEYFPDEAQVSDEPEKSNQLEEQPKGTLVETPKAATSLEGKWEGVAKEIVEEPETAEQTEIVDDKEIEQRITSAKKTIIPEKEPQTSSYETSIDTIYKVQSNDSLFKIATKYYGDGKKWIKIFEANDGSMRDPNSLYVGQELLIPDITDQKKAKEIVLTPVRIKLDKEESVNVKTHTVKAGDTLYRLAEKYYDDPAVWMKIYEANKDTIEDKGLLRKGQILIIPNL